MARDCPSGLQMPGMGMRKRKAISGDTKLAAALLTMLRQDESGAMVPVIPPEHAQHMTAREVISLFHFDHVVPHALGGSDAHHNLVPRPLMEHRHKTATVDVPQIAKTKRIEAKQAEFRRTVLAKVGIEIEAGSVGKRHKRKIPSRPFPKAEKRQAWGKR